MTSAAPQAMLLLHGGASPPPPPMLDYAALAARTREVEEEPTSPLLIQLVATLAVCLLIGACVLGVVSWRRRRLRKFLAGLPDASPDGTWLVVAYAAEDGWGTAAQSGRMPMAGVGALTELLHAAVEFGCELGVDSELSEESVDFKYMDHHGVERRVGAKTRFEDVTGARVLRVSRRSAPTRSEAAGLVSAGATPARKKKRSKKERASGGSEFSASSSDGGADGLELGQPTRASPGSARAKKGEHVKLAQGEVV